MGDSSFIAVGDRACIRANYYTGDTGVDGAPFAFAGISSTFPFAPRIRGSTAFAPPLPAPGGWSTLGADECSKPLHFQL